MERQLVSIIIPVYNADRFLKKCLDSVVRQSYINIEIICINDGSTDNSFKILQEYTIKDKRIHLINTKNLGVSHARNLGLNKAKGSFVLFVDADDWIDFNCIELLLRFSETNKCDVVMFPYMRECNRVSLKRTLFDDSMVLNGDQCRRLARRMIGPIDNEVTSPAILDSYGTIWGKLYKRMIISDLSFVDLSMIGSAEDSLFNMFAFKKARTVGYCQDVLYHYRKNNDLSITTRSIPQLKDKWKSMFSIISANFKERDDKLALSNRIALGVMGLSINAILSSTPFDEVKSLLNDDIYNKSLRSLKTSFMPLHWKVFFFSAKKKWVWFIIGMLRLLNVIRRRI